MIRRQAEQSAPTPAGQPPHVGDSLRQRREQLGWDLGEVADWLRIRRSYLQALEDGRPDGLPTGTYTIGFLRSYAVALGLDPQAAIERFRQESRGYLGHPDLSFPSPVPERGVPAGAAILLGVVLLIGAYAGWYVFSARDAVTVAAVPPVPDAMLSPAAPSPPAPSPPASSSAPPRPAALPAPAPVPVPVPAAAARTPSATPSALAPAVPDRAPSVPAAPSSPAVPPAPAGPAVAPAAAGTVTLKALAATWVQVRRPDGGVVYDHVLAPGESWTVPAATPPLVLTTGNAGGLALAVGDATGPLLGRSGAVRRNLSLDPAAVQALNAGRSGTPAAASPSGHTPAP
ncbi:helix-turn-helix domain-containing protein [Lichenicoccus sp.]|uniref:helix-turn-helix domain-containing protein n=1 Tax=Lichenicoccus sp. TaxID=2781899 RepID=UPI003D0DB5E6